MALVLALPEDGDFVPRVHMPCLHRHGWDASLSSEHAANCRDVRHGMEGCAYKSARGCAWQGSPQRLCGLSDSAKCSFSGRHRAPAPATNLRSKLKATFSSGGARRSQFTRVPKQMAPRLFCRLCGLCLPTTLEHSQLQPTASATCHCLRLLQPSPSSVRGSFHLKVCGLSQSARVAAI